MVSAIFTGVVPIVYKAQRALLDSLVQSTVWSFLTITPLLMFVCRSIGGGLVAMIPNVLPILVVFGGMAWLDYPVSIGSMMAASIALGVAVDDTIHYLTWFRDDLRKNSDRNVGHSGRVPAVRHTHFAGCTHQRPGIVGIRSQHVHADSRIRPADVDDLAGWRRGRTDHDAGLAGRSAGGGLRATSVPRRIVPGRVAG